MRLKEITPKTLMCVVGACPAVYETDRGTIILVGCRLAADAVADLLPNRVAPHEAAIEVPRELLANLMK